jgi:hypothetical protein
VSFDTTFDGAGVIRGDLTPECAAKAVLDALSAPTGGGDPRTRPQRYHDALGEAMRRLLASGLLPKRADQDTAGATGTPDQAANQDRPTRPTSCPRDTGQPEP